MKKGFNILGIIWVVFTALLIWVDDIMTPEIAENNYYLENHKLYCTVRTEKAILTIKFMNNRLKVNPTVLRFQGTPGMNRWDDLIYVDSLGSIEIVSPYLISMNIGDVPIRRVDVAISDYQFNNDSTKTIITTNVSSGEIILVTPPNNINEGKENILNEIK